MDGEEGWCYYVGMDPWNAFELHLIANRITSSRQAGKKNFKLNRDDAAIVEYFIRDVLDRDVPDHDSMQISALGPIDGRHIVTIPSTGDAHLDAEIRRGIGGHFMDLAKAKAHDAESAIQCCPIVLTGEASVTNTAETEPDPNTDFDGEHVLHADLNVFSEVKLAACACGLSFFPSKDLRRVEAAFEDHLLDVKEAEEAENEEPRMWLKAVTRAAIIDHRPRY